VAVQKNCKEKCSAGEAGKRGHLLNPTHLLSDLMYYIYIYLP